MRRSPVCLSPCRSRFPPTSTDTSAYRYRVVKRSVLGGLRQEYGLVKEAA
jgi:hypothetical protein